MKHSTIPFAFFVSMAMAFSACSSNTAPSTVTGGKAIVMTATVNGQAWSGSTPDTGSFEGYHDFVADDSLSFDHYELIVINYKQTDTGTYPISDTGTSCFAQYEEEKTLPLFYTSYSNSGTIHFTRLDPSRVTGTFSFTAIDEFGDTVKITNGTFDVPL